MSAAETKQSSIETTVECDSWFETDPEIAVLADEAADCALTAAGESDAANYALEILLSDDARVRVLNKRYRGQDKSTNVLSFAAPADFGTAHAIGSVVLAFETVSAEALAQGKPLGNHLQHLVVHGVLHLLGYDHENEDEAEQMEALERSILGELGIADPYLARD